MEERIAELEQRLRQITEDQRYIFLAAAIAGLSARAGITPERIAQEAAKVADAVVAQLRGAHA
jgi:hypothetical protein